ncbi:MAG: FG-GAP repeat protein [Planctomycetes bacterium]|nr:FG-GAP repeat protein [Planctomycetota bacterium]
MFPIPKSRQLSHRLAWMGLGACIVIAQPSNAQLGRVPLPDLLRPMSATVTAPDAITLRSRVVQVDVQLLRSAMPGHSIRIAMFEDAVFEAVLDHIEVEPYLANTFHWYGSLKGRARSQFILTVHAGVVTGWIYPDDAKYQALSIEPVLGQYVVREAAWGANECDGTRGQPVQPVHDHDHGGGVLPSSSACNDDPNVIDVLLVYDSNAHSNRTGTGAESMLANALAQANTVLKNSKNNSLKFVAKDIRALSYTSISNDLALKELTDPADGKADEVHAWRKTLGADLVAMGRDAGPFLGATGGVAWCGGTEGNTQSGFSVTGMSSLSSMTLAHEIGHNLGCAHDPANADCKPTSYGRGHNWKYDETGFPLYLRYYDYTVMSYSSGWGSCDLPWTCIRKQYPAYSTPWTGYSYGGNTYYFGTSTRDNLRVILARKQDVANYSRYLNGEYDDPKITAQPASTTLNLGFNYPRALMSVRASNASAYQWRRNSVNIAGATSQDLVVAIGDATAALAGTYDCVITNTCTQKSVTSASATVTVTAERLTKWDPSSASLTGFGQSVVGVPDVDADGFGDYCVASPAASSLTLQGTGAVSVYSGKDRKLLFTTFGAAGAKLGSSFASADFDQDGYSDLMIGAAGIHNGYNSSIYFLSGKTRTLTRFYGHSAHIAQQMATGRFNANKYPDIVTNFGTRRLQALDAKTGLLWRIDLNAVSSGNIHCLAVIGDRNADGCDEILIGMPDYDPVNKRGRFEIRSGRDGSLIHAQNGGVGDELGAAVVGGGNLRGGWDFDFAVGSPGFNNGAGKVTFYNGWSHAAYSTSAPSHAGGRFGSALAAAGDQDGDGKSDIFAAGKNFVRLLRGTDATVQLMTEKSGAALLQTYGTSIAAIDTNGDSKRDLIVGEPSPLGIGAAVWVYDRATLPNPPAFVTWGATCAGGGGVTPRIFGSSGNVLAPDYLDGAFARSGGSVNIYLMTAAKSSAAICRLGVARAELPLDALGMPGCVYQVQSVWSFVVATDKNGAARFGALKIDPNPTFVGVDLLWQWVVLDPPANAFGLTLSDAATMRIGAKL